MSRIGKQPIPVPGGVNVQLSPGGASIKGPKGQLQVPVHPLTKVAQDGSVLKVSVQNPEDRREKALWGLTRALLANAVIGVDLDYETISTSSGGNMLMVSVSGTGVVVED